MPDWFKYDLKTSGPERLAKFGKAVFGVTAALDTDAAEHTIAAFEKWFCKIGAPLRLSEIKIPAADIPEIAENAMGLINLWKIGCDRKSVEEILRKAA